MPAPFDVDNTNDETRLTIRGSLDINSVQAVADAIDKIIANKPRKVVVDLGSLDLIDSSGVGALVKLFKGVRGGGGAFMVSGARDQPLSIFRMTRMDKVFNI